MISVFIFDSVNLNEKGDGPCKKRLVDVPKEKERTVYSGGVSPENGRVGPVN